MVSNKYDNYSSGSTNNSGSDGDNYEKDLTMKWKPHATFRGVLDSLNGADTQWGQSVGIKFTDGKLVDGVLMERVDSSGDADGTIKLFPWDAMPVILNDELTADDAPEVFTEEFGGKTYRYQLLGARIEENDDPADPIEFGDFMIWEGGGESPSASAKTLAQTLSTLGRDVIVDREDINNWLDVNNVKMRSDLIGREVDVFKVIMEGEQFDFHRPVITDVATGAEVRIANGGETDSASQAEATTDGGSATEAVAPEESSADVGDFPTPVQDFVDFCVDFGLTDEDQIRENMNEMAAEDGNSLTVEQIEAVGEDEILAAIVE